MMLKLTINHPPSLTPVASATADRLILCGDMVATDAYSIQVLDRYDQTFSAANNQDLLLRAADAGLGQADLSQVEIREISV